MFGTVWRQLGGCHFQVRERGGVFSSGARPRERFKTVSVERGELDVTHVIMNYFRCRLIFAGAASSGPALVEVYAFWDGKGTDKCDKGKDTDKKRNETANIRKDREHGKVVKEKGDQQVRSPPTYRTSVFYVGGQSCTLPQVTVTGSIFPVRRGRDQLR